MKTHIRKHLRDFLAILALFVMAVGIAGYLLTNQRLRFPLVQEKPFVVKAVLENAQAVQPGQGQTVRVAGVEVGQIGKIQLDDGKAVVDMQLEGKYKGLIRADATALLRTRTGLKDMFLEVDPGEGRPLPEKGRIEVGNTAPDIDPDEILSALDTDTRDYLKLLISSGGKGLKGRGNDLREVFKRLGPLHRDLAKVTKAVAKRRSNLRSLVHNYGVLTSELGKNDKDIVRLVRSSNSVFEALGSEEQNISAAVARLPGSLRQTKETLAKVDTLGGRLRPALSALRPAFRQLDDTNAAVLPFVKEATPILRNEIRPFTRAGQPFFRDLGGAAKDLNKGEPDLTKTFAQLNRLFNIGAHNPNGAEGLTGNLARDRAREEGYLYHLGWLGQNTNSLFSTGDAQGPSRRLFLQGLDCGILKAQAQGDLQGGQLPSSLSTPLVSTIDEGFTALGNAGVCNAGGEGP